jgi:glycosyltransferase involved in cell wall biosynthesis
VLIGDGPERAALEERARALGLGDRVRFLGHRADALELYAGLDLMVSTSRYEGLPFAILEAMGLGIPVVAARIPGVDEAVVDGRTGRLIDGADAAAFAEAIAALLVDDAARAAMGHAARMRTLEHFSLLEMVEKTTVLYEEVLGEVRGRGA